MQLLLRSNLKNMKDVLFLVLMVLTGILPNFCFLKDDTTHSCNRKCVKGQWKVCKYNFNIESYFTMNRDCGNCPLNITDCYNKYCIPADGVRRYVSVINKQLPGPLIRVCKGDKIVVDVKNSLPSEGTTIHWHGMLQEGTQYSDGVPYVTQCPVTPGATFRYQFEASHYGTYFYHSHVGVQRVDGVSGPLIIGQPDEENPLRKLYDYDLDSHIMLIFDWDHVSAISKFEDVLHCVQGTNEPYSMLINGFGRNKTYTGNNGEEIFTPTARFHVEQGKRYRFRLINSGNLDCPIEFSIDSHNLTVISSDGDDFQPVEVESIMSLSGERFDFILNANQDKDVYWMRFKGHLQCEYNEARQVAVLQYDGVKDGTYPPGNPIYLEMGREGLQINPLDAGTESNTTIALPKLAALQPVDNVLQSEPNFIYFAPFDIRPIYNPEFRTADYPTPQINNISSKFLPFPLLSQRYMLHDSMFCNEKTVSNCTENFCQCPYVVKIPLHSLVDIVFINEGRLIPVNHPIHLYGYKFRVISMEKLGKILSLEEVQNLYYNGEIRKNLKNAPLKDTVNTPPGAYTIIRFKASNPGFWIMHCHIDHHSTDGMFLVFQVGDHRQMPPIPLGFATCGNYVPKIKYF